MEYLTEKTIAEPMDGWLDKHGCFFSCGKLHHVETAEFIAQRRHRRVVNGDYFLERMGYAHIDGQGNVFAEQLTDAQRTFLYAMLTVTPETFPRFQNNIRTALSEKRMS